jgi:Icc-related predicted phosphoesterase
VLKDEFMALTIPSILVLGNHDCEKNEETGIKNILVDQNTSLLEGECVEIQGVGFAGIKGFIGGFGHHVLPFWGEKIIKDVVQVGTNDALKLERALSLLETPKKVVVMHYSPIVETVVGESPEIYPFLGSTRFEEVVNRMEGTVIFHGHAHAGTLEGKTDKNIPVFNVSLPVLRKSKKEFFVYEV